MQQTGYLKVDDIHQIFYERVGNTEAPDILFLHGGPGLGCQEKDKTLFDLEACNVTFFDQRGSHRSLPKGELSANTTTHLLEDIQQLITHLGLKKPLLVGGSWGSTLALLYALKAPTQVRALVLRGIFLADKASRAYFELGGLAQQFPAIWERLANAFPDHPKEAVMAQYHQAILDNHPKAADLSLALNWYAYSINNATANVVVEPDLAFKELQVSDHLTKSKLLSHYSLHDFFIPEGYLRQAFHQLQALPITIVHGKADHITIPKFPLELAKEYTNVDLILTEEGHSAHSSANHAAVRSAILKAIA